MTKQRELILNILKNSDRHMTADEIFFLAKLQMPSIAMATIYNNLNAMNDLGIIKRTHIDGVADCFDKLMDPHDHLLCDGCGKITNVRIPALSSFISEAVGTEIDSYEMTAHYLCPDCRKKARK